jgi:hypothetical protein
MISRGCLAARSPEKTPPGRAGLSDLLAFGCHAENKYIRARPEIDVNLAKAEF